MKRFIVVIILVLLIGNAIFAQEGQTAYRYPTLDGTLTFTAPDEWVESHINGTIMLSNDMALIVTQSNEVIPKATNFRNSFFGEFGMAQIEALADGQIVVAIGTPPWIQPLVEDTSLVATAETLRTLWAGENRNVASDMTEIDLNGRSAIHFTLTNDEQINTVYLIDTGNGIVFVVGATNPATDYSTELEALVASINYVPRERTLQGSVIWQYQDAWRDIGVPLMSLALTDGTVLVYTAPLQGNHYMQKLDAGGNPVSQHSMSVSLNGWAIDPDGNLWVNDGLQLHQINPTDLSVGTSCDIPRTEDSLHLGSMVIDSQGNFYIQENYGIDANLSGYRIKVLDSTGQFVQEFVATDDLANMAISPEDELYLLSGGAIQVWNTQGNFVRAVNVFPSTGIMAVGDQIYLAAKIAGGTIFALDKDGNYLYEFGTFQEDDMAEIEHGEFRVINDLVLTPNGSLLVAGTNFTFSHVTQLTLQP